MPQPRSTSAPERSWLGRLFATRRRLAVAVILVAHTSGFLTSLQALWTTRTPQGAIAWIVSLNTFPYAAVPAYWVFGRSRFHGYVVGRRAEDSELGRAIAGKTHTVQPHRAILQSTRGGIQALERLADLPFLGGNRVQLLVDGPDTFASILEGIERARRYVLVQFYIVQDDRIGRRLQEAMMRKAREGLAVHFLYDEIGSRRLPRSYVRELSEAGVRVSRFHSTRGGGNRWQLNFRNHRKIVVTDGAHGWVGGFNVGDAYLGEDPDIGPWRDTHLHVEGPAVLGLQLAFLEDWHWATDEIPQLDWVPHVVEGADVPVLVLASGPADRFETASLMVQEAIHSAQRRVWFASPYFVPDEGVMGALKLAALRGVDVRILIPERTNDVLVHHAQYAFLPALLDAGVQVLRYRGGFLHQKVTLVDDDVSGIGTVNLDNRSFRLNFEITAVVVDHRLAGEVARMLENDFASARAMTLQEVLERPLAAKLFSRAAYLTAPIL
jgi:cardiolipin synthase